MKIARFDQLSVRDHIDLEEQHGVDVSKLADIADQDVGAKVLKELAAVVWVLVRKFNPEVTYDNVLDFPVVQLNQIVMEAAEGVENVPLPRQLNEPATSSAGSSTPAGS